VLHWNLVRNLELKNMANVKKKWVAFIANEIIPAAVVGKKEDFTAQAGVAVHVPEGYADHVVGERIAHYSDASAKSGPADKKPTGAAAVKLNAKLAEVQDENAALKVSLEDGRKAFEALQAEFSEKSAALEVAEGLLAEVDVTAAEVVLADAQTAHAAALGTDGAEAASDAVKAAQDALEALKA
jgi:hypothetical protein